MLWLCVIALPGCSSTCPCCCKTDHACKLVLHQSRQMVPAACICRACDARSACWLVCVQTQRKHWEGQEEDGGERPDTYPTLGAQFDFTSGAHFSANTPVPGKHTCPREAAAVGNVAKDEKMRLVGQPNSSSIIFMAFLLSKAGIWSCSFSSSFR